MTHVVCPAPIHPEALAMLRAAPGVTAEVLADREPATLAARLPAADALILRTLRVDEAFLALCPRLRLLVRHGVGYDIIDVPALTRRGIPLAITPEANAASVAEHTLMLMLACARRLARYDANLRAFAWGAQPDAPSFDLAGKTVLVIGFGRIGTRVANLCKAFGMRVLVRDPAIARGAIRGLGFLPVEDAASALPEADVVTLHLPSNAATRGMVDADFLARMKPGAVFVNCARGTLVEEDALAAALTSGQVGAAGLDVFEEEPITRPIALLAAPNLVCTPHVAASSLEGLRLMGVHSAQAVLDHLAGRLDRDWVVNPDVLGD